MNKKVSLGVTITLVIISMALTLSVTMVVAMRHFSFMVNDVGQKKEMYTYIDEIDKKARNNYTIDEEVLRAALAKGYIDGLNDPYAAYLSTAEYQQVQIRQSGSMTGFGLEVARSRENQVVITDVFKGSPAAQSGIQRGDILTAVDGTAVDPAAVEQLRQQLASASKVLLSVKRDETENAVELTSNTFTLASVEERMIGAIGYIRIREFNTTTPEQFKTAYTSLVEQGAAHFIFDLRNNEGGTLDAAKEIVAYLMPRGPYAHFTAKGEMTTFTAEDSFEMSVASVTLVNEKTAGEAELFAGVLQDFNKTIVVGTHTAGKDTVQQYYPLDSDKSAIRLTAGALSLVQSGKSWAEEGIVPNQLVGLTSEQEAYFELLTDEEDPQLQTAIGCLDTAQPVTPTTDAAAPESTLPEETEATEPAEE